MRGLLADVNLQGHATYLRQVLRTLGLLIVLDELQIEFATFGDVGMALDIDDRPLWNHCQAYGWVLLTENRNHDGPNSLEATLRDSWRMGMLPVITLADKSRFEHDRDYAHRVSSDLAELMFGIKNGEYCDQSRIYVPL